MLQTIATIVGTLLVCLGVDHACNRGWRKFDAFCATTRVGQAFDPKDFEGRVRAQGWKFLRREKFNHYVAMADGPVGSVFLCTVEVKDGVVTSVGSINHPW
jgi:hypothetical protein